MQNGVKVTVNFRGVRKILHGLQCLYFSPQVIFKISRRERGHFVTLTFPGISDKTTQHRPFTLSVITSLCNVYDSHILEPWTAARLNEAVSDRHNMGNKMSKCKCTIYSGSVLNQRASFQSLHCWKY